MISAPELTEIDDLFQECPALEKVTITSPVTKITSLSFYKCAELRELTLPDKLEVIEDYTFEYSPLLSRVRIPPSVTEMGSRVFHKDTELVVTKGSYAEEYAQKYDYRYTYELTQEI